MEPEKKKRRRRGGGSGRELERGAHPLGVRPWGNFFSQSSDGDQSASSLRRQSLGPYLDKLDDSVLLSVLEHLPARDLGSLRGVSSYLCAFASHEPLWRTHVLNAFAESGFTFDEGGWRSTYVRALHARRATRRDVGDGDDGDDGGDGGDGGREGGREGGDGSGGGDDGAPPSSMAPEDGAAGPVKLRGVYSDLLFQAWFCASLRFAPHWRRVQSIPREDALTAAAFIERYEAPGRPVILRGLMDDWPCVREWATDDGLARAAGPAATFRCGAVNFTMPQYLAYARRAREESPLYLFDRCFAESAPGLAPPRSYTVPPHFSEDLLSLLGADRPAFRWLIAGPERSGSFFHVDPNGTSAWNAVVRGRKRWILVPPGVDVPGVFPSEDGAEVAVPVSIAEWYLNHYDEIAEVPGAVEGTCEAGEVMFVPSGWMHLVVNVDSDAVAITQNYASRRNLARVLGFLREKSDQVSGTAADRGCLGDKLEREFERAYPGELAGILAAARSATPENSAAPAESTGDTNDEIRRRKKGKTNNTQSWDALTADTEAAGSFTFSFGTGE